MKTLILNWKLGSTHQAARQLYFQFLQDLSEQSSLKYYLALEPITLGSLLPFQQPNLPFLAQNSLGYEFGSHTGQVVLPESVQGTLVGHSETRQIFQVNWFEVTNRLLESGKKVVFCFGESEEDKKHEKTELVLRKEVENLFRHLSPLALARCFQKKDLLSFAYEPIWAIGRKDQLPLPELMDLCEFLKTLVTTKDQSFSLFYGGNVNLDNIASFLKCDALEGCLIGRMSLQVDSIKRVSQLF